MTSFSFRRAELVALVLIVLVAAVGLSLGVHQGREISATPLIAVAMSIASVLVDAYFNAQHLHRQLEFKAHAEAMPIADLRDRLISEVVTANRQLRKLRDESEEIKVANAMAQMDRTAVIAILQQISRPRPKDVWIDRAVSFSLGVAASLVASFLYAVIRANGSA